MRCDELHLGGHFVVGMINNVALLFGFALVVEVFYGANRREGLGGIIDGFSRIIQKRNAMCFLSI